MIDEEERAENGDMDLETPESVKQAVLDEDKE